MLDFALAAAIVITFAVVLRLVGRRLVRKGSEMERTHGRITSSEPSAQASTTVAHNPFGE
jgi:hypothetical protein